MVILGRSSRNQSTLQTLPLPWDSGSDICLGPVVQILQGSVPGFLHRSFPHRHPENKYLVTKLFIRRNLYSLYHSCEAKDCRTVCTWVSVNTALGLCLLPECICVCVHKLCGCADVRVSAWV